MSCFSSLKLINLVVDSPRVLSKTIFSDLQVLCDRLEQLDIEAIMEADDV
jgi:hypothetical protein